MYFLLNIALFSLLILASVAIMFYTQDWHNPRGFNDGQQWGFIAVLIWFLLFWIFGLVTSNLDSYWIKISHILNYIWGIGASLLAYRTVPTAKHLVLLLGNELGNFFILVFIVVGGGILAFLSLIFLGIGILGTQKNGRTKWSYFWFFFLLFLPIILYILQFPLGYIHNF